ncbi:hypothetical protein B0H10DRAFT_2227115 [Mycena sp. CBHHK59/15]|nr:hypothetical protein B0H10DRAFT_2227115 [Mycena sp. CBHHK59/15]
MATIPRKVSTRGSKKQPPAANKENLGGVKTAKTAKRGGTTDLDIFSEELEKKYNIEGSNTLDIVYARHENDAANATIAAQAAQLEALTRQLEAMKATERNNAKVTADVWGIGTSVTGSLEALPRYIPHPDVVDGCIELLVIVVGTQIAVFHHGQTLELE